MVKSVFEKVKNGLKMNNVAAHKRISIRYDTKTGMRKKKKRHKWWVYQRAHE